MSSKISIWRETEAFDTPCWCIYQNSRLYMANTLIGVFWVFITQHNSDAHLVG